MTKKRIIALCAVVLAVSLIVGSSYAYLSDTASETNTFTIGKIDIGFSEPSWDDTTDGKDLIPGDTLVKDPTVAGVEGDCYMRIKMEILDDSGALITDTDRIDAILATLYYDATYSETTHTGTVILEGTSYAPAALASIPHTNTTDFAYDTTRTTDAGVRYYNYVGGATGTENKFESTDTAILFTNIVIPSSYGETEITALGDFSIRLTAQAVQYANIATAAEAYTALD